MDIEISSKSMNPSDAYKNEQAVKITKYYLLLQISMCYCFILLNR